MTNIPQEARCASHGQATVQVTSCPSSGTTLGGGLRREGEDSGLVPLDGRLGLGTMSESHFPEDRCSQGTRDSDRESAAEELEVDSGQWTVDSGRWRGGVPGPCCTLVLDIAWRGAWEGTAHTPEPFLPDAVTLVAGPACGLVPQAGGLRSSADTEPPAPPERLSPPGTQPPSDPSPPRGRK